MAVMGGYALLAPLCAIPLAFAESRALLSRSGAALNESLAGTARLHMVFGLLLVVALVL